MATIKYLTPSIIEIPQVSDELLNFLTYRNKQVSYQLKKMKNNNKWKYSNPKSYYSQLKELESKQKPCLVFEYNNKNCTYSGLAKDLSEKFGWDIEPYHFDYTKHSKMIAWAHKPHPLRYYQEEAVEALLKHTHASIELPTGAGKSRIIQELCKRVGVQTVIVTPSKAITDQLYNDFVYLFGKKYVGKFGSGKKELGKMFTLCVAQSLVRLEEGTKEWEFISSAKMLIWDESHTTPAETFEQVCLRVLKDVPLRYFVSATQIRNDGADLLLKGIIGDVVYKKEFTELVEEGFLKKPKFTIITVPALPNSSSDIEEEQRQQLYYNPNVNSAVAQIAKRFMNLNKQVVIILDEFKQFACLYEFLKDLPPESFEFVHGGASNRMDADGYSLKDFLPERFWKVDIQEAVNKFNEGKLKLLIGTSAISTGVDLKPVSVLIYLQGGTSEIRIKQAIGRGTRVVEGLPREFTVVDFFIDGSPDMERHLKQRLSIYKTMGSVQVVKL
jgi:superfamily II DNA or RNA helicase